MHIYGKNYNQISRTNNTQNHQKIEIYGSQTTKDLKKPHSSRQIGGVELTEMGWSWWGPGGEVEVARVGHTFMCGG